MKSRTSTSFCQSPGLKPCQGPSGGLVVEGFLAALVGSLVAALAIFNSSGKVPFHHQDTETPRRPDLPQSHGESSARARLLGRSGREGPLRGRDRWKTSRRRRRLREVFHRSQRARSSWCLRACYVDLPSSPFEEAVVGRGFVGAVCYSISTSRPDHLSAPPQSWRTTLGVGLFAQGTEPVSPAARFNVSGLSFLGFFLPSPPSSPIRS